ncbi:MAG: FAD-dependent oxidoreductase [Acidimicrobiales bacterium]
MSLRTDNLNRLDGGQFDVLVVGGGINGAVTAASLAARGASVALVDRRDFASATSQASSNLVWGGFRYLQSYEIGLVSKLCRSRNLLAEAYPTVVSEIRFLATLDESAPFPSWLAGLGSAAYWALGRFATRPPRYLKPSAIERAEPAVNTAQADAGIEYGDYYLKDNDSRFVWSFVRTALDRGATAANYVQVDGLTRRDGRWQATMTDTMADRQLVASARVVVNAGGPYADRLNHRSGVTTDHRLVFSKGIHLVVPRLTRDDALADDRILAFFDDTERLFYVIPMANRSVIGTTDTRTDDPDEKITDTDRQFLLDQINARLDLPRPLTTADIVAERCGVRPLVVPAEAGDQQDVTWTRLSRKHEIESDPDTAMVTLFGGKLTDCLNVGEEVAAAVAALGVELGPAERWYGEAPPEERATFLAQATPLGLDRAPSVEREPSVAAVLWRRHGPAAWAVLDAVAADQPAGNELIAGSDILRAELALYAEREMIVTMDDFLRRRTKLAMLHPRSELDDNPGLREAEAALKLTGDLY